MFPSIIQLTILLVEAIYCGMLFVEIEIYIFGLAYECEKFTITLEGTS